MNPRTFLAMLISTIVGCANNATTERAPHDPPVKQFGMVQYEYTSFDEAGMPVIQGTLILPSPIPKTGVFTGTWQAKYSSNDDMAPAPKLGPQVGGGKCTGQMAEGKLVIGLNPNINDNNVTMVITIDGDNIAGEWSYATFVGVVSKGKFEGKIMK